MEVLLLNPESLFNSATILPCNSLFSCIFKVNKVICSSLTSSYEVEVKINLIMYTILSGFIYIKLYIALILVIKNPSSEGFCSISIVFVLVMI